MKIAIDYQSTEGKKTGIGVCALNLIQKMQQMRPEWEWIKYTTHADKDLNTPGRMIWESLRIPLRCYQDKPQIIYSPGFAPAWKAPARQVVTVHDLIGMIYPENLPRAARFYWQHWLPYCIKRADVVVASSESTRDDLKRLLGVSKSKVKVVPLAAHAAFNKSDANKTFADMDIPKLNRPFFLVVGTLEPRKNLVNLVKAYHHYKHQLGGDAQLVFVGKGGGERDLVQKSIKDLGLEQDALILGYVPDEKLEDLYNLCLGYVMVSNYEGFGLPVLEAMNCAKSGICANKSSLPEVAGETALYVNPENTNDIADKLLEYATNMDLRRDLCSKAFARSKEFTWDNTAASMIRVFEQSV
jgi:glycosyltransferase involved in cell wall biosynthesis